MDYCSIHKTAEVQQQMSAQQGISYLYSGVSQCPAAPVERVIAHIKKQYFKLMKMKRQRHGMKNIPRVKIYDAIREAVNQVKPDTFWRIWPSILKNLDQYL
jgi:hypothetical protein